TVTDKDYGVLTNSVNYTITQPSDAFVKVNGLGDYAGTSSKRQASINNIAISLEYTSTAYDTYEKRPAVYIGELTDSADFAVSYSNNINAGTAQVLVQGTGKFTGVCYLNFNINQADINSFNISLSFYEVYYNYVAQLPQVSAYPLVEGRDYIVESQPQTQVGTGYVYVKGINNCTGTAVKSFTVKKKSIADMSITLNRDSFEYSGYEIKPSVYISGLIEGADYDVTYSSNVNVGTGYVTITGKGIYEGTVTKSFTIYAPQPTQGTADNTNTTINAKVKKPSKATIKKLKTSKKSITVYWKKLSASGYQIEYSTSSKFKNAKRITVSSGKKTSAKISKLKKRKKYYIRVRAYKTSNGKRIYGAWSAKKSIVCK
ncbi:MAG: fibronectin type III domain-containing protein, partial [Eubacterium sp.]